MNWTFYKLNTLVALLLPLFLLGSYSDRLFREKVERKVHKEFGVEADALLQVWNSFGDVNLVAWDKNEVVIDVTITVRGNDREQMEERLESISISFKNQPNLVQATTHIEQRRRWSWFGSSKTTDYQIDYEIKVPFSNHLNIRNDYGSILLDKTEGNTSIRCDYGKLILGELRGEKNEIEFDYTSNSSIDYVKNAVINADYSGFELGEAERLGLSADYTGSKVGTVGVIDFNANYGKVVVDEAQTIKGNGDYVTLRFGSISKELVVATDYGSFRVAQLLPEVEKVQIESDYTSIRLGIAPNWDFQFEVELDYAGFQSELALEYLKKYKDGSDKYYQGYRLNQNSPNQLSVEADYGNLKFVTYE